MPTLAHNPKGTHDFEILEKFEAGLALLGHEVKSVRNGTMSLRGAYVVLGAKGASLIGSHIARYPKAGPLLGYDPDRSRQLLLRTRELTRLIGKTQQKGLTMIPLSVYTVGSRIKLEFALVRGKKQYEKKEAIKKRDVDREIRRALKGERT